MSTGNNRAESVEIEAPSAAADLPSAPAPDVPGYARSARLLVSLTLCSRILGLIRESVFGYFLSTSELLSALRVAMLLPNAARRLFSEGALSSGIVPPLAACEERGDREGANRLLGGVLGRLALVLLVAMVVLEGGLLAWRFYRNDLALELTQLVLPYAAMICLAGVASGALHVRKRFAVPAAASLLLNLLMLAALLLGGAVTSLSGAWLMRWVGVSMLLAGVLQLWLTARALKECGYWPKWRSAINDRTVRSMLALTVPAALGLSVVQLSTLADSVIAYLFVREGGERVGPAVLGYAQVLYQLPLGVFGVSLATAILPDLAGQAARLDKHAVADGFARGVRTSLFIALPCAAGLALVATPLVATLYEHGAFDRSDTIRVAGVVLCYSFGVPAHFLQHIFARTLYALGDIKTPALAALSMAGVDTVLNLILVQRFAERGLAFSTSACATLQIVWLALRLRRTLPELFWSRLGVSLLPMIAATAAMAICVAGLNSILAASAFFGDVGPKRLLAQVLCGALTYLAAALLMRTRELKDWLW